MGKQGVNLNREKERNDSTQGLWKHVYIAQDPHVSLKNGGYKYIFAITCSYVIASSRWRLPSFLAN